MGAVDMIEDIEQLQTEIDTRTLANSDDAASRRSWSPGLTGLPARLGRFEILSQLGAGAMGKVLLAADPELEREVAIKVLHNSGDELQRNQLIAEAQAMARLTHANVVSIFDVGEADDQVFIAMEYVRGQTLRRWQREHLGDWRAVLAAYLAAGRGLEAAHHSGMVHRDFKPDNVLVSDAGEVKVTDFGLAQLSVLGRDDAGPGQAGEPADACVTQRSSHGLVGTPAYMARECIVGLGATAGPAADQFAFCVSLWEGVYGQRPFRAPRVEALFVDICAGRLRAPPPGAAVPRELRRVLERGLSVDAQDRFESMTQLCARLEQIAQPFVRRHARPLLGAGLAAALALGAVTSGQLDARRCRAGADAIDETWSDARQAALEAKFLATERSYAAKVWAQGGASLERWSDAWRDARVAVCDLPSDAPETAQVTVCLDEQLQTFQALVAVLADADAMVVDESLELIAALPAVARCDARSSHGGPTLPPTDAAQRAAVRQGRAGLVRVELLADAGKLGPARSLMTAELERAQTLGYAPLLSRAQLVLGELCHAEHDHEGAEAALLAAFFGADRAQDIDLALEASNALTELMVDQAERTAESRTWATIAAERVSRLDGDGGLLAADQLASAAISERALGQPRRALESAQRARVVAEAVLDETDPRAIRFLNQEAAMLQSQGQLRAALALWVSAVERAEAVFGDRHPRVSEGLRGLGTMLARLDRVDEAREVFERSLDIDTELFGPDSARAARSLHSLGNIAVIQGDLDRAAAQFDRALAIRLRVYGPEHAKVQWLRTNLAIVEQDRGNFERARRLYQKALTALERSLGPDHVELATVLLNLATLEHDLGELAASRASSERALAISEAAHGPDHPDVAIISNNLASVALDLGECEDGLSRMPRAISIWERKYGPAHSRLATPLMVRGRLLRCLGRLEEAEASLARALELGRGERLEGNGDAEIVFELGRARYELGQRAAGRALVEQARAESADTDALSLVIDRWLRDPEAVDDR